MKSTIALLFLAAFAGMFFHSGVAAQKVEVDFVAGTDFSKYKTYKWQRVEKGAYPAPGYDKLFMRSIDAELAKKGLTKTETDPADVYVTYQFAMQKDMEYSSFSNEIGWPGGANSFGVFQGATTSSVSVVRNGSMVIDIYDVAQKKQVWQAFATKTIKPTSDFMKNRERVQIAMAKILKDYPPANR